MSNKNDNKKSLVLVILGPTASGKTSLAVKLAKRYAGEIISADSRQVYQGLDVGSGKDLAEYGDVKYHLIDVADVNERFDLAQYQKLAKLAIENVLSKDKLPILVGGSGLYLQAIVDNYDLNKVSVNCKLRDKLELLSKEDLQKMLKEKDKDFFKSLNNSELNNKRRLIRYLEVLSSGALLGKKKESKYDFLIIGLDFDNKILREKIQFRLKERLEKEGLVKEVESLHLQGTSWERLISLGLEYKYVSYYLQKKISYPEMFDLLLTAICQFAKRQKTWFKRMEKQGIKINYLKDEKDIIALVDKHFL
jgi:tRNA dimethylallyltransferase